MQVDVDHAVNGLEVDIIHPDKGLNDACHIEQRIGAAQLFFYLLGKGENLRAVGNIDLKSFERRSMGASKSLCLSQPVRFDVKTGNPGAPGE